MASVQVPNCQSLFRMLCTVPTIHYFEDFHCLLVEAPPFSWLDAFLDRPKELKFLLRTEAPSVREQGHPHLCLFASLLEDRSELLVTGPSEIIVKLATACSRAQCESFEGASHRIPIIPNDSFSLWLFGSPARDTTILMRGQMKTCHRLYRVRKSVFLRTLYNLKKAKFSFGLRASKDFLTDRDPS